MASSSSRSQFLIRSTRRSLSLSTRSPIPRHSSTSHTAPLPSTTFYPTDAAPLSPLLTPKPTSPFHYTTQPSYFLALSNIDQLTRLTRHRLHRLSILPRADVELTPSSTGIDVASILSSSSSDATSPTRKDKKAWIDQLDMARRFNTKLSLTQHRRVTTALASLADLLPYAQYADSAAYASAFPARAAAENLREAEEVDAEQAEQVIDFEEFARMPESAEGESKVEGYESLSAPIVELLGAFRRTAQVEDEGALVAKTKAERERESGEGDGAFRRRYKFHRPYDEYGRMYGVGRRKEASARVWIIPASASSSSSSPSISIEGNAEAAIPNPEAEAEPPIGHLLLNGRPLSTFTSSERASLIRPLLVTRSLGAYNVFALAQGGGRSGQAQAAGLALARALASVEWSELGGRTGEWWEALKKEDLVRRDPRMVERKKTNMKGARARYTWVKR